MDTSTTRQDEKTPDGLEMLENLIHEIEAAETGLATLQDQLSEQITNQARSGDKGDEVSVTARALAAETKLLRNTQPELIEDEGIRYYIALGMLEQQVTDLKELKNISEKKMEGNQLWISDLDERIKEQTEMVERLESDLEARMEAATSEEGQAKLRRQLESERRATKQLTWEFKSFMKEFIDKTFLGLSSGMAPIGFLLQALWTTFQYHSIDGWVNIKELDFEVMENDVELLLRNDIIKANPKNPDEIQLEDFTMKN